MISNECFELDIGLNVLHFLILLYKLFSTGTMVANEVPQETSGIFALGPCVTTHLVYCNQNFRMSYFVLYDCFMFLLEYMCLVLCSKLGDLVLQMFFSLCKGR